MASPSLKWCIRFQIPILDFYCTGFGANMFDVISFPVMPFFALFHSTISFPISLPFPSHQESSTLWSEKTEYDRRQSKAIEVWLLTKVNQNQSNLINPLKKMWNFDWHSITESTRKSIKWIGILLYLIDSIGNRTLIVIDWLPLKLFKIITP